LERRVGGGGGRRLWCEGVLMCGAGWSRLERCCATLEEVATVERDNASSQSQTNAYPIRLADLLNEMHGFRRCETALCIPTARQHTRCTTTPDPGPLQTSILSSRVICQLHSPTSHSQTVRLCSDSFRLPWLGARGRWTVSALHSLPQPMWWEPKARQALEMEARPSACTLHGLLMGILGGG
jgi:hypothetical protein